MNLLSCPKPIGFIWLVCVGFKNRKVNYFWPEDLKESLSEGILEKGRGQKLGTFCFPPVEVVL